MNEQYATVGLFGELSRISSYPDGVVAVPSQISGLAFFPGGTGVYQEKERRESPAFPFGQVMIVGQDFDTFSNFKKSLKRGEERRNVGTWGNILPLLDRSGIPRTACFFTNAYMGLRANGKNSGPFISSRSKEFRATCHSFFLRQLALQRPRLVLCLGTQVLRFMAECSPDLLAWNDGSFASIDDKDAGVLFNVVFDDGQSVPAIVALVQPSFRPANIGRRRYRNERGEASERALLSEARQNRWNRCAYLRRLPSREGGPWNPVATFLSAAWPEAPMPPQSSMPWGGSNEGEDRRARRPCLRAHSHKSRTRPEAGPILAYSAGATMVAKHGRDRRHPNLN